MHAKYQCSTFNTSEDMSQVKVFVTDRQTDGQRDGQTHRRMRFNVPTLFESGGQKCIEITFKYAKMTKSKKMSKTRQKFDFGMEPKITTLLPTCF